MARTAPIPNIPPIPGMNPGIWVAAGAGGGGGGSGSGNKGKGGKQKAGTRKGSKNANGGGKAAKSGSPDPGKYPTCGTKSHPVDVVTGRAFTHPIVDFELSGPLPLRFERTCSSVIAGDDLGIGWGWAHTLGWRLEERSHCLEIWTEKGTVMEMPKPEGNAPEVGDWGWVVQRAGDGGFLLDARDGVWRHFALPEVAAKARAANPGAPLPRRQRYLLTTVTDRNGNHLALRYDRERLSQVTDSAGRTLLLQANSVGQTNRILVSYGTPAQPQWRELVRYDYDSSGNLTSATDADGYAARYDYDEQHRMVLDVDRSGLAFHFRYDREGRCVESWGDYPERPDPSLATNVPELLSDSTIRAKGVHHCAFVYGEEGYTEVSDSTTFSRFMGNEFGLLDKEFEGGAAWNYVYDDSGNMLRRQDPEGGLEIFERDSRGRLVRYTDPLGHGTHIEREPVFGLPTLLVDAGSGTTQITRDRQGNAIVIKDPTGAVSSFDYDHRGLIIAACEPNGATTRYEYDLHANLTRVTLHNGSTFLFTYDAFGRRLSETDPTGATTRYTWSDRGDLLAVQDPLGNLTRYRYDGEHHLIQIVDPLGQVTEMQWGGYHRLCVRRDANGNQVRLAYNREGELLEVHNEKGEVHTLERGFAGQLNGERTFDGRQIKYRYDLCGRPTRIQSGLRHTIDLEYDLGGNLITRTMGEEVQKFTYGPLGLVDRAEFPGGSLFFERDVLGRVTAEELSVDGESYRVDVKRDALGDRISRSTSQGYSEQILRDALGNRVRTTLDGTHVVNHQVDALGRETGRHLPGGGVLESQFDALGRLARRRALSPTAARPVAPGEPDWIGPRNDGVTTAKAYQYDAIGELVGAHDRDRGATQYQYDPVGQILAAIPESARTEVFRYDSTGNLHEAGNGVAAREYGQGNKLVRRGDTQYQWNDLGQLVGQKSPKGTTEYKWNDSGLLERARLPDGREVSFTYDPFARRLSKKVERFTDRGPAVESFTRFMWDGDTLIHELRLKSASEGDPIVEQRSYLFEDGGFEPVAQREPTGEWLQYVNDPAGAPDALIDSRGNVACEYERTVWGYGDLKDGSRATTPIRLQGQYADEETGLSYNRYRYVLSETQDFCSVDPLGLGGGFNLFGRVPNPFEWADPLGLVVTQADPKSINFSQRTVQNIPSANAAKYAADMKSGAWDWNKSGPIRVMNVNGQLVSYDNRRLKAAQLAGLKSVPIEVVDPNATMPGSKKTWKQAFSRRCNDSRNVPAVPPSGVSTMPADV